MVREAPHHSIRVAARLANAFALDLARLGGFGRDVIDGLLVVAITQANVAVISRSPELQRTYAGLMDAPPDELRRPVSVSALANSLHIPFETARRRIHGLIDLEVVRVTPKGVIIPQAPMLSPFYRMGAEANYQLVRTLYHRLRGIGLLDDLPPAAGPAWDPANPPVRLVMRLASDYLLRLAEPLTTHIGDLISGLIMMEVIHANTEHLSDAEGGRDDAGWSAEGFVADAHRRPVRVAPVAERLGIPEETVRRRLNRLVADDRCERALDGYVVTGRILAREGFIRFMVDNQSHLHRLFAGLAEFGVLAEWERETTELRGAA